MGLNSSESSSDQVAARAIQAVSADDGSRRLIVFDNVDDPESVTAFLPATGRAKMIVTSNRQEFTTMPGIAAVPVGMFTPAQGVRLLTEATGQRDTDAATLLGQQLGWLPLGLAQAAAYMVLDHLTYRQYLQKLATIALDEILVQQAGADHPGVLKATELSIDGIKRADPTGHAPRLLTVLAVLAPEGISRSLLTQPHVLAALGLDDTTVSTALRVLANASLITLAQRETRDITDHHPHDDVVVAVHRLTATVVRHHVGPRPLSDAVDTAAAAIRALTSDLPFSQVAHRRRELDELVTHIQALDQHNPHPTETLLVNTNWAGEALREVGRLDEAIALHQQNLADWERVRGADHPDTLTSRENLAGAYQLAGRLDEAITLYQQALADRERVLGTDHLSTLISRNNLAYTYQSAGRLDEAISLHQQNLTEHERVRGADDRHTLISRNNLALAYQLAGRLDEAITLHQQALADRERLWGAEHLDTLTSRDNLASAYQLAGRLDEAITLHQQALAGRERVLGVDHPATLTSRNNLASAYRSAGRLDEAITNHQQNLADHERVQGTDHPDTLTSRTNLANVYALAGRVDDAMTMHQQTVTDRERVLGTDHPDTLFSRISLTCAYALAGRVDEAITLHQQTLTDRERVLRVDHP